MFFKWWFARWLYRTQVDACGSRVIEWYWWLVHRCWSPLPTYRIACDAGMTTFWGWMCHPICSVSATPSKARLIGFCNKWRTPVHCHREKQQGFTSLHSVASHSVNGLDFPFVTKANQPSFAWCCRHGANWMVHLSQKVVTSGIACYTISRKWWQTSAS